MKDVRKKYKKYHTIKESRSIPFDLHMVSVFTMDEKKADFLWDERMMYMDKYKAESFILDFYKSNSNIIDNEE